MSRTWEDLWGIPPARPAEEECCDLSLQTGVVRYDRGSDAFVVAGERTPAGQGAALLLRYPVSTYWSSEAWGRLLRGKS